jgi:hypothetical protein
VAEAWGADAGFTGCEPVAIIAPEPKSIDPYLHKTTNFKSSSYRRLPCAFCTSLVAILRYTVSAL